MRRAPALAIAIVAMVAADAHAQTGAGRSQPARASTRPISERIRIVMDGGVQVAPGGFAQAFTGTTNAEDAPISTDVVLGTAGFFDGGIRIPVARRLSIGVVGYLASGTGHGTLSAAVPHPFYFDQPRTITGDLSGLARREAGVHLELVFPVTVSAGLEVMAFGGPSYMHLEQDLVSGITYTDSYPYDTASFESATTTTATAGAFGFNVGGDVTWRLGRSLRAGAIVRYSQANESLSVISGDETIVRAGGFQAGASLRIVIHKQAPPARRAPPPPPRRR